MAAIDLGIVYEPYPAELAELSAALTEMTGEVPTKIKLPGLGGPNEGVQIFVNLSSGEVIGIGGLALLLRSEFLKELTKQAVAELWKNKAIFFAAIKKAASETLGRLAKSIGAIRAKDQTVVVAVKMPGDTRNAGLLLTSDDEAEIAWAMLQIDRHAERIREVSSRGVQADPVAVAADRGNPDSSIAIEVLENGDLKMLGIVINDPDR